ncbi:MAG: hypothetical protein ACXW5U_18925 [Thermoanaerobaculia bacterium]
MSRALAELHVAFSFGEVHPPPEYEGGLAAALGRISSLQEFARSRRVEAPQLTGPISRPAYYLPINFEQPITRLPKPGLVGRLFPERMFVGSANRLLDELDALGPHLSMTKDAGEVGIARFERMTERGDMAAERYSWGVLRWFARESISAGAVIRLG